MYKTESKKGFRILGIAWQSLSQDHQKAVLDDESHLVFSGFALFYDPPKQEAFQALKRFKSENIKVYLLTGDSEDVAMHLCQELELSITGVLLGSEIETLSDDALLEKVEKTNLYCRMSPGQKERIILALKSLGHVVGFLGDGINDAPSLYSAHIGISVDTAADVAKEAADLILLKKNLNLVTHAILEGRKIYANIMKYLMMMTSSNFGNMLSMAAASLFLPFLPMLPGQIILNNFLYDISQTAIPFDHVDKSATLTPQQWNLKRLLKFMVIMGPLSSFFDITLFVILLTLIKASPELFQTGWFMESLATQVLIIFVIRTRLSIFQSRPQWFLATLSLTLVSIGSLLPYTPLGGLVGFVAPPLSFFAIILGIVLVYLLTAERVKLWFFRQHWA